MNQDYSYFGNLGDVTVASLRTAWFNFLQYVPQIIGAIIILIIGWIVATLLGKVVQKIVELTGIDSIVARSKLNERMRLSPRYHLLSRMIGAIVKWFIIIATLMTVAGILNLPQITDFLRQILLYIPQALVAVIILTIGMLAAEFVENFVDGALTASELPVHHKKTIGSVAKYAIIIFSIMAALTQLGIVPNLIQILFAGIVLAMALAFGLGGKEEAARFLANFRRER
jgi:small-conductance mechanosensitive channel